jgi:NTP pyrophosphatase (non-canonical NTP hydrolase)
MQDLIKRNYASIVKRGYITPDTTDLEFIRKIEEEVEEAIYESLLHRKGKENNLGEELADVILTCLNYAHHFSIDIEKELHKKIEKNEKRKD